MRVVDLVPDNQRVFSVGRLDKSSEGLMLLTNDGELAQRLAHPRFRVSKTYFVVVAGILTKEELNKLRKGVYLAEGVARIDGAKIKKERKGCTEVEIILSEGKNREIRRILARTGHKVVTLRRVAIGPLRLGQLPPGASRELTSAEVKALYECSGKPGRRQKSKPDASKPSATTGPISDATAWPESDEEQISFDYAALDSPVEEAWEMDDEDLAGYDDDFVDSFADAPRQGSVLTYDEESERPKTRRSKARPSRQTGSGKPRKRAQRKTTGSRGTSSTAGIRGGSSKRRTTAGRKSASRKKAVKPKATGGQSRRRGKSQRSTGKNPRR